MKELLIFMRQNCKKSIKEKYKKLQYHKKREFITKKEEDRLHKIKQQKSNKQKEKKEEKKEKQYE